MCFYLLENEAVVIWSVLLWSNLLTEGNFEKKDFGLFPGHGP